MKPTIEVFGQYLENSLYERSRMNSRQVNHLIGLFESAAKKHDVRAVFEEMIETYGNENPSRAVSEVIGLMDNNVLYEQLRKLNSERTIDTNPKTRIQDYCQRRANNIAKMSVEIDGKPFQQGQELAQLKVPKVFQAVAHYKSKPVRLELDVIF